MGLLRSVTALAVGVACVAPVACATSGSDLTTFVDDDSGAPLDAGGDAPRASSDARGTTDAHDGDATSGPEDAAMADVAFVDVRFVDVVTPDASEAGVGAAIDVPQRRGDKATIIAALPASPQLARLTLNSCRGGTVGFAGFTSFAYVTLRNADPAHDAVVSVWTSRASGGPIVDTLIASYASATPPQSASERLACSVGVEKRCHATGGDGTACLSESGGREWAGLMDGDGNGVVVPAAGEAVVYVASYDASGSGDVLVSVRAEAFR